MIDLRNSERLELGLDYVMAIKAEIDSATEAWEVSYSYVKVYSAIMLLETIGILSAEAAAAILVDFCGFRDEAEKRCIYDSSVLQ